MMIDELIGKVDDIGVNSGSLASIDFVELARMFFSRGEVQTEMLDLNRDRLYYQSKTNNGALLPFYAAKTARHKRRVGLPDQRYTYYESGRTHESLEVAVTEDFAMIGLGEDAPEYAFDLDSSAWGLTDEEYDNNLRSGLLEYVQNELKDYFANG